MIVLFSDELDDVARRLSGVVTRQRPQIAVWFLLLLFARQVAYSVGADRLQMHKLVGMKLDLYFIPGQKPKRLQSLCLFSELE